MGFDVSPRLDKNLLEQRDLGEFGRRAMTEGLKSALEWRDGKFQDGRGTEAYQRRRAEQESRLKE